jgi:ankyrin repeat protein
MRVLLDRGADATAKNEHDLTPSDLALVLGQVEVTNVYLEHGMEGFSRDIEWTPLHRAFFEGNIEAIHVLIDSGADLTAQTDYGLMGSLHYL